MVLVSGYAPEIREHSLAVGTEGGKGVGIELGGAKTKERIVFRSY